jgi:hypothetical protein
MGEELIRICDFRYRFLLTRSKKIDYCLIPCTEMSYIPSTVARSGSSTSTAASVIMSESGRLFRFPASAV